MEARAKNPFEFGTVVEGLAFCNRTRELKDLRRAMENGEKLFVFSERRFGKTSLVRAALKKLPARKYLTAYVDLWPTDNEAGFATAVAKAVTESMSTGAEKMLETAKQFFSRLTPSVTIDESGKATITFGTAKRARAEPLLEEVLSIPAKIAVKGERRVVMVLDEFQQILEYQSDLVERKLRSVVQNQGDVAYLFLGSRKHLIQEMVLDRDRPLYRAGGHYPLGPIVEKHWQPFIAKRFRAAGKSITEDTISAICDMTQGHPFYTQHLCHALWEICAPGRTVDAAMLAEAVKLLLARESYAYITLWESLNHSQTRLLRGLANEGPDTQVYSSGFTKSYNLAASSVQRAVKGLLAKDIIDLEEGFYIITDRFFRLWIQSHS